MILLSNSILSLVFVVSRMNWWHCKLLELLLISLFSSLLFRIIRVARAGDPFSGWRIWISLSIVFYWINSKSVSQTIPFLSSHVIWVVEILRLIFVFVISLMNWIDCKLFELVFVSLFSSLLFRIISEARSINPLSCWTVRISLQLSQVSRVNRWSSEFVELFLEACLSFSLVWIVRESWAVDPFSSCFIRIILHLSQISWVNRRSSKFFELFLEASFSFSLVWIIWESWSVDPFSGWLIRIILHKSTRMNWWPSKMLMLILLSSDSSHMVWVIWAGVSWSWDPLSSWFIRIVSNIWLALKINLVNNSSLGSKVKGIFLSLFSELLIRIPWSRLWSWYPNLSWI